MRTDGTEILHHHRVGDLGDGTRQFYSRGSAADDDKCQQRAPSFFIGFALGHLEGQQNATTDLQRVLDALQTRRVGLPFGVTEVGVPGAGGQNEIVVLHLAVLQDHFSTFRVDRDHLGKKDPRVLLPSQDGADRVGDVVGRKTGGRDFIQQRLKQMIVATIDDRDSDIGVLECPRRTQSAEPRADDHDMRLLSHDIVTTSSSNGNQSVCMSMTKR